MNSKPYRIAVILVLGLLPLNGCQLLDRFRQQPVSAPVLENALTKEQLIEAINRNTNAVQQLSASVRVSIDGMPQVTGDLLLERPKRLRMKVGFLGMNGTGVDIGSNDELFWIWTKSSLGGQTPAIYFARHEEYAYSEARRQLRLEPQWIIDALGLVEFSPDAVEGPFPRDDQRVQLVTQQQTPIGMLKRFTVVDPNYGWILQQSAYIDDRRVVFANSSKYEFHPEAGISLPKYVEIHVFDENQQETKLVVHLNDYQINSLYVDPATTWGMPRPADIRQIELARGSAAPNHFPGQSYTPQVQTQSRHASPLGNARIRGSELLQ